jgi:hypothetical protein
MGSYSLFIGIPSYGKSDDRFAIDSGWDMMYTIGRKHPEIGSVWVDRDLRTYRQEARNQIIQGALTVGATHALMLDDDMVFNGEDFTRLWKTIITHSSEVHMLSALYYTRQVNTVPCIFKLTSRGTAPIFFYEDNQLIDVPVVGFGMVLFNMELFRKLNGPWFNLGIGFGEDAAFCTRLTQAGFGIKVDTGVKIGHIIGVPQVVGEREYLEVKSNVLAAHQRVLESGGQVEASELVPDVAGRQVDAGYTPDTRSWWRPAISQVWNRHGSKSDGAGQNRAAPEVLVRAAVQRQAQDAPPIRR